MMGVLMDYMVSVILAALFVVGCAARPNPGNPCDLLPCVSDMRLVCAWDGVNPPTLFVGSCRMKVKNCRFGTDLQQIDIDRCDSLELQDILPRISRGSSEYGSEYGSENVNHDKLRIQGSRI